MNRLRTKGKKGLEWDRAKAKLKKLYVDKGITRCENCGSDFGLSFHHRHKRSSGYYDRNPELLGAFEETILLCQSDHEALEYDKTLSDAVFGRLRGNG